MADTDIVLKISNGLDGESQLEGYANHIDISSFSWGVSNQATFSSSNTAGGGAGKAHVHSLSMTKTIDKSSPQLFWHCATGKHLESAQLFVHRAAGDKKILYFKLDMKKVFVTSYSPGSGGGAGVLIGEAFALDFEEMEMTYWPQLADGGQGGAIPKKYNAAKGQGV